MTYSFQQTQLQFTQYLRDPDNAPAPDLPADRMQVYSELIYNNIENFLASAFPVMRKILSDDEWHSLARDFIRDHQAQTPYFLQISEEFVQYFLQANHTLAAQYPFLTALAHYEWIELVLDIADDELSATADLPDDIWSASFQLSPVSVLLAYPWPVHKISAEFLPQETQETFLLVYRNRDDQVKFIELTAVASRFLQLCRDIPQSTLQQMNQLVSEGLNQRQLADQLPGLIQQLSALGALY
jgi:uncharacterized protein